jgi:hypothetical protein
MKRTDAFPRHHRTIYSSIKLPGPPTSSGGEEKAVTRLPLITLPILSTTYTPSSLRTLAHARYPVSRVGLATRPEITPMASQPQVAANRLNALKSTGPRTAEGKAVSSQNAFQSGLDAESQFVYGENQDEFAVLQQEYMERFRPVSPEERFQIDNLIRCEWMLRRFFRVEAHLWEYHVIRASRSEGTPLGESFDKASTVFMRLQRRVTLTEKAYNAAYAELQRLRAERMPVSGSPAAGLPAAALDPDSAGPLSAPPQLSPDEYVSAKLGSFLNSLEELVPVPDASPSANPSPAEIASPASSGAADSAIK